MNEISAAIDRDFGVIAELIRLHARTPRSAIGKVLKRELRERDARS